MSSSSLYIPDPPTIATISKNGVVFSVKGGSTLPPPPPSSSSSSGHSLRLVTLNMASGNAGPQWQFAKGSGKNHHDVRRQIIETMFLESRADILCVQESVIKGAEWGYRSENASSSSSVSSLHQQQQRTKPSYTTPSQPQKLGSSTSSVSSTTFSSKAVVTTSSSSMMNVVVTTSNNINKERSEEETIITKNKGDPEETTPRYVRTQEMALTHCGQTFLYYNSRTCELVKEGKINGGELVPSFPVLVVRKKKTTTAATNDAEKSSSSSTTQPQPLCYFLICSVHLHPFVHMGNRRQNQISKLLIELDRLESLWRLSSSSSSSSPSSHSSTCHKIIAGDFNMTNEQFPNKYDSPRLIDCWYEFFCGSQNPRAEYFAEKEPFINAEHSVLKFFKDSYTFGGLNDYNSSGMKEQLRSSFQRGPFFMRYDRVYCILPTGSSQQSSSTIKIKHMQRFLDNRFSVLNGDGVIPEADEVGKDQDVIVLGGKMVKDLSGRLLSDHFGLLIDFEV